MSSRPLLIAGIFGGILAGIALFVLALAAVAIDGAAMSGQVMAMLVLGAMLGFVLDATWLTLAVDRLSKLGPGGQDEEGGEWWRAPGSDPTRPQPPSEDTDWSPALAPDFSIYRESGRDREPIAG